MNYRQARIKITLEQILIYPLVLLGQVLGLLFPLKHDSPFFLFFPSDIIGGATKVNADIISLLAPYRPTVIFSKKYANRGFAKLFTLPGVHIIDLRDKIDNKYFHFINIIYRGILSAWINRSGARVVFGGEAIYFYKVTPYLRKDIKVVELCHLNTWFNYSQAFIPWMDSRITSTPKIKRDLERQYGENGVPARYAERITFIDNWVDVPPKTEQAHDGLNILFVGRGARQKRVHLISRIAERIFDTGLDIRFTFVGDVLNLVSEKVKRQAKIYEYIEDKQLLYSLYDSSDILILTSAYEGLPIVVMDMMVRGKVVLSTAVDGIPDYIEHKKTGLLIDELNNEEEIVEKGVTLILEMYHDREGMRAIGDRAYHFARERFTREAFDRKYREIFGLTA